MRFYYYYELHSIPYYNYRRSDGINQTERNASFEHKHTHTQLIYLLLVKTCIAIRFWTTYLCCGVVCSKFILNQHASVCWQTAWVKSMKKKIIGLLDRRWSIAGGIQINFIFFPRCHDGLCGSASTLREMCGNESPEWLCVSVNFFSIILNFLAASPTSKKREDKWHCVANKVPAPRWWCWWWYSRFCQNLCSVVRKFIHTVPRSVHSVFHGRRRTWACGGYACYYHAFYYYYFWMSSIMHSLCSESIMYSQQCSCIKLKIDVSFPNNTDCSVASVYFYAAQSIVWHKQNKKKK